ncbi:MAG: TlpA family protein disulfide reductase [bacterium]|nr:TlpA family protein disulfide reductase [bacterium]
MSDAKADTTDTPHESHSPAARWGFAAVVVVALVAVFWPASDEKINFQAFRRVQEGQAAPVGMLIDSSGRPIPLGTRMAPVTLVHFWATWCPPCITEIPSILRMADHHSGDHNFSLIMIAVQDDVEKAGTFLGKRVNEALFDHDWKLTHSYGTEKVPETHLVVKNKLVESFIGATNWDDPEIRQRLQAALDAVQDDEEG